MLGNQCRRNKCAQNTILRRSTATVMKNLRYIISYTVTVFMIAELSQEGIVLVPELLGNVGLLTIYTSCKNFQT